MNTVGMADEAGEVEKRARSVPLTSMSEALDADPAAGGSSSAPADDDPVETSPS
ncbi:MAG: hypothetical protein H0U41_06530 [Actinobacteria bacterium]|nr:hypothetical protein [Actinomycetota bacterium]